MDGVCGRGRGTDGRDSNPVAGDGSGRVSGNDEGGGMRGGTDGGCGRESGTDGGAAAEDLEIIDDGNIENIWNHVLRVGAGFKCGYCYWMKKGGGATRLREHLGGILGNVMSCNVVPPDVRDAMRRAVRKGKQKRRDAKDRKLRIEDELMQGVYQRAPIDVDDDDEMQMALAASMKVHVCRPEGFKVEGLRVVARTDEQAGEVPHFRQTSKQLCAVGAVHVLNPQGSLCSQTRQLLNGVLGCFNCFKGLNFLQVQGFLISELLDRFWKEFHIGHPGPKTVQVEQLPDVCWNYVNG